MHSTSTTDNRQENVVFVSGGDHKKAAGKEAKAREEPEKGAETMLKHRRPR